jgi:DNA topoisomerase-3
VKIEEKSTKPPKRFTQGDLLKAMESAGKQIDDEILRQQMKGKGLGTVATRPAIIENLLQRGYIRQEQKALKPTEKGMELISLIRTQLPQAALLISSEMTGQMEYQLGKVEKGELSLADYMHEVEEAVGLIVNELRRYEQNHGKSALALAADNPAKKDRTRKSKTTAKSKTVDKKEKNDHSKKEVLPEDKLERFGVCPRCGGDVIEGKKGYGCSNWKQGCSFVVWKTPICGKVLTSNQLRSLLKKGKTPLIKGFKSKNGQSFSAYLVWENAEMGNSNSNF